MTDRIRTVIAEPGPGDADRGAEGVARALRDAGMEVVYTGPHQTPEQIVGTVIQEDADAVGLILSSGAPLTVFERIVGLLAENGAQDVVVFGGGIVPDRDLPEPGAPGVARIFTPGADTTDDVVAWVRENVAVTDPV